MPDEQKLPVDHQIDEALANMYKVSAILQDIPKLVRQLIELQAQLEAKQAELGDPDDDEPEAA